MAYNDIVIPNLASAAIQESLQAYLVVTEDMFRGNREMLVDFYFSQQTDKEEYQLDYFNRETDPDLDPDYPHNLILSQLNITKKVIDKKAKNYVVQPVRDIDGKTEGKYTDALLKSGIKTTSKLVERLTWLLGDNAIVIIPDETTQKVRLDIPCYYRPIFMGNNSIDPVGIIYSIGKRGDAEHWLYWDAEKTIEFEGSTWEIIEEKKHGLGTFPLLFTHAMKPFRSHWTRDAQDLVDTNRDININITSINNAIRYLGFPVLAALGIDPKDAKDVKVGFDKLVAIAQSPSGDQSIGLQFLYPEVDWVGLISTVKFRIEAIALTWNIDIKWELSGDIASGVALKILSIDDTDDRNEMRELLEEYFEIPLFEKLKVISENVEWLSGIEGNKIIIDWQEPHEFESIDEQSKRMEMDFKFNLSNPISEIMKRNPDLDEKQAMAEYQKNVKMNSLINKPEEEPSNPVDKILKARERKKTVESLN